MKYAAIPPSIRLQMVAHAMKRAKPPQLSGGRHKPPKGHRKAKSRQQYANTMRGQ